MGFQGVDGRKDFSDFGEHFFHFLGSHLCLVELYGIEAHCEVLYQCLYLDHLALVVLLELA